MEKSVRYAPLLASGIQALSRHEFEEVRGKGREKRTGSLLHATWKL
jgi:hypothetical protein